GKPIGGSVVVDAAQSSQFATAVLLVAPCAARATRVRVEHLSNPGYVELTLDSMRTFGATFSQAADGTVVVPPGQTYAARDLEVEFDASAAMHLLALAVASGGRVTIENARPSTLQPDMQLLAVFERMGAQVERGGQGVTVQGPARLLACDADLSAMPDQVPTLAAIAAVAQGTSTISNVALVRGHETDRLAAAAAELRRLGARVEELPDGLRIHGSDQLGPAPIATYGDHRMAMAFAALAARVPGIVIDDPGCVSKTYPGFWQDAAELGLEIVAAQ
ncbi:MAG: 3-phosphoshikimate 1-carboxyvinyltransferase, partial [Chloroflexota bacterium]